MSGFGFDMPPGLPGPAAAPTAAAMALRITNGPSVGREFPLNATQTRVGRRNPPADAPEIDLTDCERGSVPMVSRNHAEISWVSGELFLVGLLDRNGTYLNGERLPHPVAGEPTSPVAIKVGDHIRFANLECEVVISG